MLDSGGAGGVKCYNGGHFPPIRQDGRFNYVLQAVLCKLQARLSKGCDDAALRCYADIAGCPEAVAVLWFMSGWGQSSLWVRTVNQPQPGAALDQTLTGEFSDCG